MWERIDRSTRPAREFAQAHDLAYLGCVPLEAAHALDALPLAGLPVRHRVSGQWRGRSIQRFEAGCYTVEQMTMPRPLPTVHVIPAALAPGTLAVEGRGTTTGDPDFDRRWCVTTDNERVAAELLSPGMREAFMHPAAQGRAVTFHGEYVSSWADDSGSWGTARVRLEFLAVVVGRIAPHIWKRFDLSDPCPVDADAVWLPAPEQPEVAQWAVAPMPEAVGAPPRADLSDTGEFDVALLSAELDGTTFIPEPEPASGADQGSWLIAPAFR